MGDWIGPALAVLILVLGIWLFVATSKDKDGTEK